MLQLKLSQWTSSSTNNNQQVNNAANLATGTERWKLNAHVRKQPAEKISQSFYIIKNLWGFIVSNELGSLTSKYSTYSRLISIFLSRRIKNRLNVKSMEPISDFDLFGVGLTNFWASNLIDCSHLQRDQSELWKQLIHFIFIQCMLANLSERTSRGCNC
jgi:hypothetical protein